MFMFGSARADAFGKLQQTPEALGGTTQSAYIVVATSTRPMRGEGGGGGIVIERDQTAELRSHFSCSDPEGHLWNFGDYDPWTSAA